MDSAIISGLISAAVAITVALISFFANRHALRSERETLERQLQRRLTEKLYDKRLESYPLAFEITDALSGERLFSSVFDVQNLLEIRDNLLKWNRKHGFVMSDESIQAFYELRDGLDLDIETATPLSKTKRKSIFQAKNRFRRSLRNDVNLLYVEERDISEQNVG